MAQDWSTNFFDQGNVWSTDLQNIENALFTLRSMFSGTLAPANPLTGAPWMDTGKGVLKSYSGSAWNGLMHGDALQKLWVYRNSAMAGWVVDTSVSDRVLAFKGGGTYTVGGAAAGGWAISGLSSAVHYHGHNLSVAAHLHQWHYSFGSSSMSFNSSGASVYLDTLSTNDSALQAEGNAGIDDSYYTSNATAGVAGSVYGTAAAISHNGAWRPAASVGTLQRLNI